ncbi:MAG: VWA domain-containing protein [Acidobacteria bacterium]|nr:MAG: VWA domain-containing protein [Acidobacteriota bacterium]
MIRSTHFQDPWVLAFLALLPLLVWWHHRRREPGALIYSSLPERMRRAWSRGLWRVHLPFYLRLVALALLIVAAARPQLGLTWEQDTTEGIDVQIALDVSGSMAAEDFQPKDRLTVAKEVVQDFIARRARGDRIGVVIFAGRAMTKAPLTTDRAMLRLLLDSVELNSLPDGTAIGLALAAAAARLKDSAAKSKVIVLVTDGVNNAGAIDPASAAAVCEGLGIKVYTVGVGTAGTVPVPVQVRDPISGRMRTQRMMMNVEVDEELLRSIAGRTGGRFFKATDPESLRQIFAEIDQLERTPMEIKRYVRYQETFQPLAWAALALLIAPLLLATVGLTAEP